MPGLVCRLVFCQTRCFEYGASVPSSKRISKAAFFILKSHEIGSIACRFLFLEPLLCMHLKETTKTKFDKIIIRMKSEIIMIDFSFKKTIAIAAIRLCEEIVG